MSFLYTVLLDVKKEPEEWCLRRGRRPGGRWSSKSSRVLIQPRTSYHLPLPLLLYLPIRTLYSHSHSRRAQWPPPSPKRPFPRLQRPHSSMCDSNPHPSPPSLALCAAPTTTSTTAITDEQTEIHCSTARLLGPDTPILRPRPRPIVGCASEPSLSQSSSRRKRPDRVH